jgi:hypothetical protein
MTRPRSRAEERAAFAKRRQPKAAGKAVGPLLASRRLFDLDLKLRPLLESLLGHGQADQAMQASLAVLRASPRTLRDRPGDLAKQLFERLRRIHPEREGECLVLAAEAVRAASLLDRLEVVAKVRRRAEQQGFEDFSERDGLLWTLQSMQGWLEAGRTIPQAIEQTRAKWGTNIPAGFALGVESAFERVTRQYGGAT